MLLIKRITTEQAFVVADIVNKSFAEQAGLLSISEKDYPNYVAFEKKTDVLKAVNNGVNVFLLYSSDAPIGTIRYSIDPKIMDKGYINRLAILPEYRGNSYGEELMRFAESELISQGIKKIEITIVKQFNRLEKYYNKLGYFRMTDKNYPALPFRVRYLLKLI